MSTQRLCIASILYLCIEDSDLDFRDHSNRCLKACIVCWELALNPTDMHPLQIFSIRIIGW
jgi:hypothetical protein